ncbi:uncharacterized protein TNCV_123391 [Trichonephila clavipes]|nr:uncharacterized protein TNCV_123391 [Trichonephila clavipes]
MIDVDAARLQLFINTLVSDVNEEFSQKKVKNFDESNLPQHARVIFCSKEDTKDTDEDNEDIQYHHHWIDDEILNFNDDDNED